MGKPEKKEEEEDHPLALAPSKETCRSLPFPPLLQLMSVHFLSAQSSSVCTYVRTEALGGREDEGGEKEMKIRHASVSSFSPFEAEKSRYCLTRAKGEERGEGK